MTPLEHLVLQVVCSQQDGYLISSDASAFIAEGLVNKDDVDNALVTLQDQGFVEFYTEDETITVIKTQKDKDGNPVLDDNEMPVIEYEDNPDKEGNPVPKLESITTTVDSGWVPTDTGRQELNSYGN